ncbi:MAG: CoA pyrophosphatase [Chloroflexi bacterium]|nr:CoA pyrophosphatase [Chloroflexota bacterium]
MPLLQESAGLHLLFIRRAILHGDRHSGQVAFPGGAMEDGDESPVSTALRETREELGIPGTAVEVLGKLQEFLTVSNYLVTPVVGLLSQPAPITASPTEVGRVFSIPLAWLMDPVNRYTTTRTWSKGFSFDVIFYKEFNGETLWGASARFTTALIDAIVALKQDG